MALDMQDQINSLLINTVDQMGVLQSSRRPLRCKNAVRFHLKYRNSNKRLGSGGFGQVMLYKNVAQKKFAVKVSNLSASAMTDPDRRELIKLQLKEMEVFRRIKQTARENQLDWHPNLIKIEDWFWNGHINANIRIVFEFMPGDLDNYRRTHRDRIWAEGEVAEALLDISDGLAYLHSINIVHRDLKMQNVLVSKMHVHDSPHPFKLIDYNTSKITDADLLNSATGTLHIMDAHQLHTAVQMWYPDQPGVPNVVKNTPIGYDRYIDCYALGVIAFDLLRPTDGFYDHIQRCGGSHYQPTLVNSSQQEIDRQHKYGWANCADCVIEIRNYLLTHEFDWENYPNLTRSASPNLRDLLDRMFTRDKSRRIAPEQFRGHAFLAQASLMKPNPMIPGQLRAPPLRGPTPESSKSTAASAGFSGWGDQAGSSDSDLDFY